MPWDMQLYCWARGEQHIDVTGSTIIQKVDNNTLHPKKPESTTELLSEPKISPDFRNYSSQSPLSVWGCLPLS
jgi:hypothetical protein